MNRWEKTRLMGRKRFIWLYGVLAWGLSMAVPWSLAMWYFDTDQSSYLAVLALAIVTFCSSGYINGALMWRTNERLFAQTKAVQC